MKALARNRSAGLALADIVLLAAVAAAFPSFVRPAELAATFDDTAILIILAFGQMAVLLTRGVDLSIAAIVALSGMAAAQADSAGLGVAAALAIAVLTGTALGAINGVLVWRFEVPPIVTTLGTMAFYRGLVFLVSDGVWITNRSMSPAFLGLVRESALGLTLPSWLALLATGGAMLLFGATRLGRSFYAAGSNPEAARYVGIGVGRTQCAAFILSGLLGGLCGYLWVARFAIAYTDIATGFELQVIAACVIGGASIAGGSGTVVGVTLGALFLGIIKNALPLVGISPFWQMAISGIVIVIAVVINSRAERAPRRHILEGAAA